MATDTRLTRLAVATITTLGLTALPGSASAQNVASGPTAQWVGITLTSVLAVTVLWLVGVVALYAVRKWRVLSPSVEADVSRVMQIVFGGLFLLAGTLPYLALNHPVATVSVIVAVVVAAAVFRNHKRGMTARPRL